MSHKASDSDTEDSDNETTPPQEGHGKIIAIVILIILLLGAIGAAIFFALRKTPCPPPPTPPSPPPSKLYLLITDGYSWDSTTGDYLGGVTLAGAKSLATAVGGQLATKAQLETAYNKGFNSCVYGWTEDIGTGALFVQTSSEACGSGTGVVPYTTTPGTDATQKTWNVYVYGPVPPGIPSGSQWDIS